VTSSLLKMLDYGVDFRNEEKKTKFLVRKCEVLQINHKKIDNLDSVTW
jgi:hypothetical protein